MRKKKISQILLLLAVGVIIVYMFFPFYWLFISSLKGDMELYKMPPNWIVKEPQWENYQSIFTVQKLGRNLRNSLMVALITTLASLAIGATSAYALAKFRMRFKNLILSIILSVSMFPGIVVVSPLYIMFREAKLINTYFSLVLPYLTFSLPLTIWILTTFFRQIPDELVEAAAIDGAKPFTTFAKVIAPLAAPGVFTAAILTFIGAWNELLFAKIFITSADKFTVPVALTLFQGQYTSSWQLIAAAAVVITLPLIIMVLVLQKWIIAGLTAGAIKD
ncbi:carbohydrate ABC transporter permease [Kosmotoga pacifica]|uniref:Sugar ABC transporter permease n=1 Tax=Kosmotoga pacifica TaxID=1330330 RepID=A0A0G2ZDI4_9BACT|nr:carbohydrate ABC transporter permease [Kosmotoga pacifica]AKI97599.1 sugar ABC transporter permease [Kosmotoga pacifica]